jgi:uncharacterized protein YecE (DUF72 family)
VSRYSDDELDQWAERIRTWTSPAGGRRDVYVYFDNDAKVHAPRDALRLMERVGLAPPGLRSTPSGQKPGSPGKRRPKRTKVS